MSTYLRANHTVQGGHINPQSLMAHDASVRFNYAPDRVRVIFDHDRREIVTEMPELNDQSTDAVEVAEFYRIAGKLAAMTARGLAEMSWEFGKMTFRTTQKDLEKFDRDMMAKMPAGCSRELCEDCPARNDCDRIDGYCAADI